MADKTWCPSRGSALEDGGPGLASSGPSRHSSPGSWQDYYTWRGLSLDSPMAVLLTYPLTVYYVITHLVPQSCKEYRQDWRVWGCGCGCKGAPRF